MCPRHNPILTFPCLSYTWSVVLQTSVKDVTMLSSGKSLSGMFLVPVVAERNFAVVKLYSLDL